MAADQNRCPAPGVLEGLLAERLSGAERDRVETHVESCAACQEPSSDNSTPMSPENRPSAVSCVAP